MCAEAEIIKDFQYENEEVLSKRIVNLLSMDSPKLIEFSKKYIENPNMNLNHEELILKNMLYYTFYVKNPESPSEICRASQELRGFAKVFLKVGESKKVSIELDENAFKVYSTKKAGFETVGGKYVIQVGESVKKIKLEKEIEVAGEKIENLVEKFEIPDDYLVEGKQKKFDMTSSMLVMSKKSLIIRGFLAIILIVLRMMNKGASADSPIVKIQINTIKECPVSSLISTSGGAVGEGMAKFFVWCANHHI